MVKSLNNKNLWKIVTILEIVAAAPVIILDLFHPDGCHPRDDYHLAPYPPREHLLAGLQEKGKWIANGGHGLTGRDGSAVIPNWGHHAYPEPPDGNNHRL